MTDAGRKHWETLYSQALLELDRAKLTACIRQAEEAIQDRLNALSGSGDHHAERQAIEDALQNLRVLRETEFAEDDL